MPRLEEVSNIKHAAFREAQALTRQGDRQQAGLYLVETANFVQQALRSESEVLRVFAHAEEIASLQPLCEERGAKLFLLRPGLMNKLVGTGYETATTAAAVVRQRLIALESLCEGENVLLLAGERIQDPRNVGVLVRTAEAAGCKALLLSADSADPFSRAAVRSTTGSITRLPLCLAPDLCSAIRTLREQDALVVAGSARAEKLVYDVCLRRYPLVVLVGNETEGLTLEARDSASEFVRIPLAQNGPSSLNVTVAAGILLFEAVRQGISSTPQTPSLLAPIGANIEPFSGRRRSTSPQPSPVQEREQTVQTAHDVG